MLKTTPVMLMTSLTGKPWPNLTRKGLSKEGDVIAFGDWKCDCRSSMEGNAVWRAKRRQLEGIARIRKRSSDVNLVWNMALWGDWRELSMEESPKYYEKEVGSIRRNRG